MLLKDESDERAVGGPAGGRSPNTNLSPERVEGEQIGEIMDESGMSEDSDKNRLLDSQDSGKIFLYPESAARFPFKTADRLLDDILHDLSFINSGDHSILYSDLSNGILKSSVLAYSRKIGQTRAYNLGSLVDQVVLQTKFEYGSVSCPQHNHLQVFMGVLIDVTQQNVATFNNLAALPIFHVKVTVKTRDVLERTKKKVGITHYHFLDESELHPYDKQDLLTFDSKDPQLLDYAIYVSSDSNKLILIEIFKPEFDSQEERDAFKEDSINSRYEMACKRFDSLDSTKVPTQPDCINTLFKIFKGPLNRKSSEEPRKTINPDNISLNSHIDPTWLTSKYGFELHVEKDEETGEEILEYAPPDLTNYHRDWKVRRLRESFTRKCLELIFFGRVSIRLLSQDAINRNPKVYRIFSMMQTNFSTMFWFQLLGEYRAVFNTESGSLLDSDHHFIDLSACYNYIDKDIIRNYETQCSLDPENIGVYVDALNFIANRKGAYQLIAYCGKQDYVGQEALDHALSVFQIDSKEFDPHNLNEGVLLSIYKNESVSTRNPNRHADLKSSLRLLAKFKKSSKLKFYADYEPYRNVTQAYEILEVDESVDDDIIQTAYTVKVNDAPGLKLDCDRALYTVAIHARSLMLFNFLMQQSADFLEYFGPDKFSYQDALSFLQVNENVGDDTILEIFQHRWYKEPVFDPDQFLDLKSALSKIGLERNSKLISHFIDTGIVDASCIPVENWPTGLNNIGNTCYLNSLLQYYFSISSLRQYVLDYRNTVQHFLDNQDYASRRIGGREVTGAEVERSVQFVYQLRDLFSSMIHSQERCVTPRKELAYLAFVPSGLGVEFELPITSQTNMNVPAEKENYVNIDSEPSPPPNDEPLLIDFDDDENIHGSQLNKHSNGDYKSGEFGSDKAAVNDVDISMAGNDIGEEKAVNVDSESSENNFNKAAAMNTSTRVAKISSDQLENALEMGRQQDVTECIGNVLFQLESASDPISLGDDHEQNDLVKQLFYGNIKQNIIPLKNETQVRTKYERFLSLLVNIGDHPKDIYDALDLYFRDEYLKMEEYGDVKRAVAVTDFPTILQIQIQRVYYDRERLMPFKSVAPLPFNETIYMDRYSDTDNSVLINRKIETEKLLGELNGLKARQRELLSKNNLGLSRKGALIETSNFLKSDVLESQNIRIEKKTDLAQQLDKIVSEIDRELSQLYHGITQLESKISHQFDDFKSIGYSLFAVFIHRGEASYGHYWIYIKDRHKSGIWRKYNDETITEVPENEVFNFSEGNTATPYFLVYVKQGHEHEIEPLKRELEVL
ncbi:ubiquitin-specific protease ubp2 [Zygosaccharomyces mellis]|uniref:Ubiquitin carboxyl-terminal hydrolase 2 n=1 Tax=Zygosaccharomyces mellis TaxID=42258 RepID=A0A4C2EAJ8_9SACH|nr:ubiquitin-specific protease ubp2 [Zygosaccharomyces mellis]